MNVIPNAMSNLFKGEINDYFPIPISHSLFPIPIQVSN